MAHFHMMSGMHAYMPDQNEVYETRRDAIAGMKDFGSRVVDDCRGMGEKGHYDTFNMRPAYCYRRVESTYLEFFGYEHGVEYAEVTECDYPGCGY